MWTRGFLILCAVITAGFYLLLREASVMLETSLDLSTWLAPPAVVVVLIVVRWLLLPRSPREVRFHDDQVELPRGKNSRRTTRIAYEEIRTIVPLVSRGQPALVVDGPRRTEVYLASDFPHPQLWRVLWGHLTDRISRLPEGPAQLTRIQRMAQLSQETSAVKGRFTRRLFWVIAAIFVAQIFLSPPVDLLEFLYFGANSSVMVLEEGQIWRVVTANLLHGNGLHFAVNAFALYFLGTYSERLYGQARTIVLILGTALAGAAASLLGSAALFAVGISTALFGLLGAYLALHLRFGASLPPPYRQSRRWWTVILGANLVISVAVPVIDGWGHLGGFVAGLVLGWLMTRGLHNFAPRPASGALINLSAAGLVALFAVCTFWAVGYATGDHPDDELTIARALLERSDDDEPALLAQVSRQWSRHEPRPEGLDPILVALAEKAFDRSDELFIQWRAAATVVSLAQELGDPFDEPTMHSGVRRFEAMSRAHDDDDARRALSWTLIELLNHGEALIDDDAPYSDVTSDDGALRFHPEQRPGTPQQVYLLAVEEQGEQLRPRALIHGCLSTDDDTPPRAPSLLQPEWKLRPALSVPVAGCPGDASRQWKALMLDAQD